MNRYEIFQSISQGENGTLSRETEELVSITNELIRAATNSSIDEAELCAVIDNVIRSCAVRRLA